MNPLLLSEETRVVWVGYPDKDGNPGDVFQLAGPQQGRLNVVLSEGMEGHEFAPTEQLFTEGALQDGATFQRSIRNKREFTFDVHVRGATPREFFINRKRWFRSWSTDVRGFFAFYTKSQGWQFLHARRGDAPRGVGVGDPAYGHVETYEMTAIADDSLHHCFEIEQQWINSSGSNEGVLRLSNRSDQPAWARYTMNGPGKFGILDPTSTTPLPRIVWTPTIAANQTLRIDTHPMHRTARLSTVGSSTTVNVWGQLAGRRWLFSLPPNEVTEITVLVEGGNLESSVVGTLTPRSEDPY